MQEIFIRNDTQQRTPSPINWNQTPDHNAIQPTTDKHSRTSSWGNVSQNSKASTPVLVSPQPEEEGN